MHYARFPDFLPCAPWGMGLAEKTMEPEEKQKILEEN